jgi:phage-related protein
MKTVHLALSMLTSKATEVLLELLWMGGGWPGLTVYAMPGVAAFIAAVADPEDADAIDAMFEYVGRYGPPRIKSKCRRLAEKIFELKPGAVRLPFFYDESRRATIIITHGFLKQIQKTPPRERHLAEKQRGIYLVAFKEGSITYEE